MIEKNGSIFINGKATIRPLLGEATFLESSLGENAQKGVFNAGYHTYRVVGMLKNELECSFWVTFYQGILCAVGMAPRWPGLIVSDWSGWSLENELEKKRKNDNLLEQGLGSPPYNYRWGNISSQYEAKIGSSTIILSYRK